MPNFINMVGYALHGITVLSEAERTTDRDRRWRCICGNCGKLFKARGKDLRRGDYISCGCLGLANARVRARNFKLNHGKHGTPLYKKWKSMRMRCGHDPDYLARGISVCARWDDYANFESDMAPTWKSGLSLERLDSKKDYSPDNCTWIPLRDQAKNRTNCVKLVFRGKLTFLHEIAVQLGIRRSTLWNRYRKGERAPALFRQP